MVGSFKLPITAGGASSPTGVAWTQAMWQAAYDSYQRPADWLALPALANGNQKIVMLHKVMNSDSNYCAFIVAGNYTVDWGDGTAPQNYASGATATHIFDYNASGISSQTPSVLGYRQCIVTVTPQAGQNLTTLDLNVKYTPSPTGVTFQTYSTGWLDIRMAGQNFTRIGIGSDYVNTTTLNVYQKNLEIFEFVGTANAGFNNTSYMFKLCNSLGRVVNLDTSNVTNMTNMFIDCWSLPTVPLFNCNSVTNTSSMFGACYTLITVPLFSFSSAFINGAGMFNSCYSLIAVPLLNLSSMTTGNTMFATCQALTAVPLFNLGAMTNGSSFFSGCSALVSVPLLNLGAMTDGSFFFNGCAALASVPLFNLSSMTNGSGFLQSCASLASVPLFNLSAMTNGSNFFNGCKALITVPLFAFPAMTNGSGMFQNCTALMTVPLLNLSAMTNGTSMFNGCTALTTISAFNLSAMTDGTSFFQGCTALVSVPLFTFGAILNGTSFFEECRALYTVPLFNFGTMTNASRMFFNCYSLASVPLFDFHSLVTASLLFWACRSLTTVPLFNFTALTAGNSMFGACLSLPSIPLFNFNALTNNDAMFYSCYALTSIPAFNFGATTVAPTLGVCQDCYSLSSFAAINFKKNLTISNTLLSKASIESIFTTAVVANTPININISGSQGAEAAVFKTPNTTAGSAVLVTNDTSSLAVGMLVTGTNISDAKAVTIQAAAGTITRTAHGIPNGKLVYFATLVTTTGIVVKTPYYVINATANTFQVSLTNGGAAITLTSDGSGTIQYPSFITAINTNVNYTIDVPATATGGTSTTNRKLNTSLAVLKGSNISG